jgi:hypothetical protein
VSCGTQADAVAKGDSRAPDAAPRHRLYATWLIRHSKHKAVLLISESVQLTCQTLSRQGIRGTPALYLGGAVTPRGQIAVQLGLTRRRTSNVLSLARWLDLIERQGGAGADVWLRERRLGLVRRQRLHSAQRLSPRKPGHQGTNYQPASPIARIAIVYRRAAPSSRGGARGRTETSGAKVSYGTTRH